MLLSNRAKGPERIEDLKRRLYTRGGDPLALRRSPLTARSARDGASDNDSVSGWAEDRFSNNVPPRSSRRSILTIFLIVAVIFFLIAVGFAAYTLYRGGNVISPANVELVVDGPKTVKAGEILNLQVLVANKNTTPLNSVDLILEFPPGTRSPFDMTKEFPRTRIPLETIAPGASANQTIKAVVFGEKDIDQQIKVSVEYRIADSNAIFDKVDYFNYQISSSPITLNLTLPAEINSGQLVNLDLEIAVSDSALRDLVVTASYPPGFTFTDATPPPSIGTNVWRWGDVPAGARPRLKISGKLEGQDDDPKSFRFSAGIESARNEGEIAVNYGDVFKIITIKRPFVALTASINGDLSAQEYVADSGNPVRVDIAWVNNLPTEVTDGELTVTLGGTALDQRTVVTSDGFYQSATNQIIWRPVTSPALVRLSPGARGQVSFNFAALPLIRDNQAVIERPTIELHINFRARRVTPDAGSETIETTVKKQVKINSTFQLASSAIYHGGPFTNRGPLPPRVGQETTYTILWSVINSSNNVTAAAVKATLPAYVRWLGVVNPETEKLTFDNSRGEVNWDLGVVDAGRGLTSAAREVAFQVVLLPSISQTGDTPVIVTTPTLTGTDSFTHQLLTNTKRSLDVQITGDSLYQPGVGTVAP
ncbi:MAG TPA: hypothetical protein VJB69_02345 [Candidatus Paceibacterota bacterium]